MGIFSNRDNKKGYCVFCGKELSDGKCTACGREAKEVVSLSSLNWQKVPMEVADALGEQKKQLFGNPLYTVKEMITNGDLFIADIHFDAVYEEEFDRSDDDEGKSEYSYYVQFSTPELAPCDRDCETSAGQYDRVEELLKNGQHEGKILWGRKRSPTIITHLLQRMGTSRRCWENGCWKTLSVTERARKNASWHPRAALEIPPMIRYSTRSGTIRSESFNG